MAACKRDLDIIPLPMSRTFKEGGQFQGVIDWLQQAAIHSRADGSKWQQHPVPEAEKTGMTEGRKRIQEAAAETDDQLLEQYLAAGELTPADLMRGLRLAVHAGTVVPLYAGSALKNIGIVPLLNAVVEFLPTPNDRAVRMPLTGHLQDDNHEVSRQATTESPFSAVIFKTIIDPFVGRLSYRADLLRIPASRFHAVQCDQKDQREKRTFVSAPREKTYGDGGGECRRDCGHWQTQGCTDR